MQNQDAQKTSNVVSLFSSRDKAEEATSSSPLSTTAADEDEEAFQNVMEKNLKNKERMARERANANKSVLRSYRIKH